MFKIKMGQCVIVYPPDGSHIPALYIACFITNVLPTTFQSCGEIAKPEIIAVDQNDVRLFPNLLCVGYVFLSCSCQ